MVRRTGRSLHHRSLRLDTHAVNAVEMSYLEGQAMLLTAFTYHLNSRKMSAIDESPTTYRRRNPVVCRPNSHRSVVEIFPVGNTSRQSAGRARVASMGAHGAVANVRFGKRKAGMQYRVRGTLP